MVEVWTPVKSPLDDGFYKLFVTKDTALTLTGLGVTYATERRSGSILRHQIQITPCGRLLHRQQPAYPDEGRHVVLMCLLKNKFYVIHSPYLIFQFVEFAFVFILRILLADVVAV